MADPVLLRIRGCILGGAIGDAVGLFTEFFPRTQCLEVYGPSPRFSLVPKGSPHFPPGAKEIHNDRHRAAFKKGGWTDDTDQTLLILLSFLRSGGRTLDPLDFAKRLRAWVEFGLRPLDRAPLGIGSTVGAVVRDSKYLDHPIGMAKERWEKTGKKMAANGAVMRTGIIGLFYYNKDTQKSDRSQIYRAAIEVATTTHGDPRCLISCAITSGLVGALLEGVTPDDILIRQIVEESIEFLRTNYPESALSEEHTTELNNLIWQDQLELLKLDEGGAIGYTYKALACGLWSLRQALPMASSLASVKSETFENLITEITMAGGDSDTNCAVAGPILGALFGMEGLPEHWVEGLTDREWLLAKADALASLLGVLEESYDFENDVDTLIDGGKGEMTKEDVDKMFKAVHERMFAAMGMVMTEDWKVKKKKLKNEDKDKCIVM